MNHISPLNRIRTKLLIVFGTRPEALKCFPVVQEALAHPDIDVEICEAVNEARENGDGIVYKKVEAVPAAAVIMHKGGYDSLRKSYYDIMTWIEDNGFSEPVTIVPA